MSVLCLVNQSNITVVNTVEDCSGFIAQPASYYTSQPTLHDLFTIPLASDSYQMFLIGLGIPLLAYMVSSAYGVAINWFSNPDHER